MVISYFGGECFKVTQGDLTLAFNPPSKDSSLKASKFGADIALVSLNHEDFNGVENAAFGEREPFVISGPGEYEVKGVAVRGFGSESNYGGKGINTIYSVSLEGINLCFLGALSSAELPQTAKQELDDIDILFLPIGPSTGSGQATDLLDYSGAYALAVKLEPKVIVPMHYTSETLKSFLKEAGEEVGPVEKLTVKKKDLEGKEGEIIVLQA
ncbi:MAG: MBL fold metallo-hydrolase [Patescibacteria group bacterium]|nr:MBL fold metallo-hydrolase [Patescibacteria group bacterium]